MKYSRIAYDRVVSLKCKLSSVQEKKKNHAGKKSLQLSDPCLLKQKY